MVIFVTVKMILDKDYKLHISRGRKSETEMAHKKKYKYPDNTLC